MISLTSSRLGKVALKGDGVGRGPVYSIGLILDLTTSVDVIPDQNILYVNYVLLQNKNVSTGTVSLL